MPDDLAELIVVGCCVKILNSWATPGNYWFVMPPRPGRPGPHTLYMSNGKAFEGESHEEVMHKAAKYLEPSLQARVKQTTPKVEPECMCSRAAMGSTRCESCLHDLSCPIHTMHRSLHLKG